MNQSKSNRRSAEHNTSPYKVSGIHRLLHSRAVTIANLVKQEITSSSPIFLTYPFERSRGVGDEKGQK